MNGNSTSMKEPYSENYDSILDGFPLRLDFKRYAKILASNKDVMVKLKKKGAVATSASHAHKKRVPSELYDALIEAGSQYNPAMQKAANDMSQNDKFALGSMSIYTLRAIACEENIKAKKLYQIFELMLVDEFLEAIGEEKIGTGATFSEELSDESIVRQGAKLLHDYESGNLHTLDKTIVAKFHGQTTTQPPAMPILHVPFVNRLIDMRIGKLIMEAIENAPLSNVSTKAANALFAISSMLNSKVPMEVACQLEPSLYERHFSGIGAVSDSFDESFEMVKSKIDIGLLAAVMDATMRTCEYLSVVTALSPDEYQLNTQNFASNARFVAGSANALTRALDKVSANLVPLLTQEYAATKRDLESILDEIKGSLGVDVSDILERVKAFDRKFEEILTHADKPEVPTTISALINHYADLQPAIKDLFDAAFGVLRTLKEDVAETTNKMSVSFADTDKDKQVLDDLYAEIYLVKTRFKTAFDQTAEAFNYLDSVADDKIEQCRKDDQALEQTDSAQLQDETYAALEAHLDELTSENKALTEELNSKRVAIAALEQATKGRDASYTYPEKDKIRAIESAITSSNKITPESALLVVSALRENVDILPSAFESARESSDFDQSQRLLQRLMTLTGEYYTAISTGTPDSEARKLFASNEFAANESETTMSTSALRKERTYIVKGQPYEFEQHIRIGVADDTRKTIRVYFRVIDGRMVIAHCGRHKSLK